MARSDLHSAAGFRDLAEVKALLKRGVNVNARDSEGCTPLHEAAGKIAADIVDVLLAHGAKASARNKDKATALHDAAKNVGKASDSHRVRVVTSLLDAGCGTEVRDGGDNTALFYAASLGHLAMVRALLARGANPNPSRPKAGPLYAAREHGHTEVERMLTKAGAKDEGPSTDSGQPEAPENPLENRARVAAGKQAKGRSRAEYLGLFTSIGGSLDSVLMSARAGAKYGGSEGKDFRSVLRVLKKRLGGALRIGGEDALAIVFGDNSAVHVLRLGNGDVVLVPAHYLLDEEPNRKRLLDLLSSGPMGKLTKVGSARIKGDAAVLLWIAATAHELDDRAIRALARAPRKIREEGGGGTTLGLAFALKSGAYVLWSEATSDDEDGYSNCYWLSSSKRAPAAWLPPAKDKRKTGKK